MHKYLRGFNGLFDILLAQVLHCSTDPFEQILSRDFTEPLVLSHQLIEGRPVDLCLEDSDESFHLLVLVFEGTQLLR